MKYSDYSIPMNKPTAEAEKAPVTFLHDVSRFESDPKTTGVYLVEIFTDSVTHKVPVYTE